MAYNILVLDPAKWDVWFAGQKYKDPEIHKAIDWCWREEADLCFNLAVFDMSTGLGGCYVHAKGKDIAYGCEDPKKSEYSDLLTINSMNSCRGYSNGIKNGIVKVEKPKGGVASRNGIGITYNGHIIIAQSNNKVTELAFCNAVNVFVRSKLQAVKLFVLQDGGGSTQEYSAMSKLNFAPDGGRKVPNVVCVKQKYPQYVNSVIYKGCKNKADVELVQIALGGIECDGVCGNGTVSRIRAAQKALGFPVALQLGIASAKTINALGYKADIT